MPTNMVRQGESFGGIDNILASEIGLRSPRMVTLDEDAFYGSGDRIIRPGSIITRLPNGLGRVFPSAVVTTATFSGANVSIDVEDASLFVAGDRLVDEGDNAIGNVTGVDIEGKTITVDNLALDLAESTVLLANSEDIGVICGITVEHINATKLSNDVACYTSASVYSARLPYWTAEIQEKLPEITLVGEAIQNANPFAGIGNGGGGGGLAN